MKEKSKYHEIRANQHKNNGLSAMKYWLVKSEPGAWSWDDHVRVGVEPRDGVPQPSGMQQHEGDEERRSGFFLSFRKRKENYGVLEVVREYHPDPSDLSGRFGMVSFKALHPVKHNTTLAEIKADPRLRDIALVKQSRLSVMPIDEASWNILSDLSGVEPR